MCLEDFFIIKRTGSEEWGNVFLTNSWTLFIDFTKQQHDLAMKRLGICNEDVIISGCVFQDRINFRSCKAEFMNKISNSEAQRFMAAIEKILNFKK